MKTQKVASWLGSLLFIAIISSCAQPVQSTPTLSLAAQTIPITMTIAARTSTPTLTPSATNTPIPATPTDVPTLPAEGARQRLLALLENNNGCRLPCLWGITPGKSTSLDARSILLPLRGIAETAYFDPDSPDSISPLYIQDNQRLYTDIIYLYNADSVINLIGFESLEEELSKDEYGNQLTTPIFDLPLFLKRVQYYSLSHVLSEQGMPESVVIRISGLRYHEAMEIVLLYPQQGIWADYTMVVYDKNIVKYGCPAKSYIDMFLVPPGNPDSFYALLDKTDWGVTKVGYKSINEATSMSVEEFYETFRNPTNQCIESPTNIWPTPER